MQTKLSKDIIFNYIKNFCYSPVYSVTEISVSSDDLPDAPFQFSDTVTYVPGAYVVKDGQLYLTIRTGAGPWYVGSINNTYSGEVHSGETMLADVDDGTYDHNRFIPITIEDTLPVYAVYNDRKETVVLAFDSYAHAVEYIRTYITWDDYSIVIEQDGNKYTATWEDHILTFYEPTR